MTTLKEQRLIAAHLLGRRDYLDGAYDSIEPIWLTDEERDAYRAGFQGEKRRTEEAR